MVGGSLALTLPHQAFSHRILWQGSACTVSEVCLLTSLRFGCDDVSQSEVQMFDVGGKSKFFNSAIGLLSEVQDRYSMEYI